jgi:hypothetical protein
MAFDLQGLTDVSAFVRAGFSFIAFVSFGRGTLLSMTKMLGHILCGTCYENEKRTGQDAEVTTTEITAWMIVTGGIKMC